MCKADKTPKPSASGAPGSAPGCATVGCPLATLIVHVHKTSAGGPALADVTVNITGPESRSGKTDASGKVAFEKVQAGHYSISARKDEHSPDPVAGAGDPPTGGKQEVTLVLNEDAVVQIKATRPGTNGVRKATDKRPDNVLTASASSDMSLATNAPVILVRGCKDVELEAVTSPAGKPVKWEVKANENSDAPPTITPTDGGKKAKLKTNVHGSMSVIATLGSTKVIWNVVFVWVKVDVKSSVILSRNNKYADAGSGGGWTSFRSGQFSAGQYPWEAKVKIKVVGGGNTKKLGTDKVKLHLLHNGIQDTLTGHYAGGGTAAEKPKGGLPIRDSNGAGDPWMDNPATVTPDNVSFERELWTADAPAGSFPTAHKNTGSALQSITGVNGFRAAIASVSDDATNALMVHAKTEWSADFKGKVDAAGNYSPDGAKTTKGAAYELISSATGGQDAGDAGFETFEPRFNGGTDTTWTP